MIITYEDHNDCLRIFDEDAYGNIFFNVFNYSNRDDWEADGMIYTLHWSSLEEIRTTVSKRKDEVILHDDGDV